MNKFGTIKSKILQKITDAYATGDKDVIKNTLKLIKEKKEFLNMYLFYEEIESKNIEDKNHAELFIEEITPLLKKHSGNISKFLKSVDRKLGDVSIAESELYSHLDLLAEDDSLKNIDKKIIARKKLVEHLTIKKEGDTLNSTTTIANESLLNTVLASNFNALYDATLTEEDKKTLKTILSISDDELKKNFNELQEEVTTKMRTMCTEEKNDELKNKLNHAITETEQMKPTKFNYHKLSELKRGI